MKQLIAVSWDHGPASALALAGATGLSALGALIAAGPFGAAVALLPLALVAYSAHAYLRRTADERDQLLARVVAHQRLRRTHATLLSLELARPLLPPTAWSASSARRPRTGSGSTPTA